VGDVVAHGFGAHKQASGDFGVTVAPAIRSRISRSRTMSSGKGSVGVAGGGEKVHEPMGDLRPEIGFASGYGPHHLQVLGGPRL
jgi:hypothetical protein